MTSNRIPEEINQYRPGPCTEVKLINNNYYVYMYKSVRLKSGKWGKQTGKAIGKIIPEVGFIPNKNYHLYEGESSQDDITVLEYGQYDLIDAVASDVKADLEKHFNKERASQIFAFASILYANDFTHLDQVQQFYEQSWLSQRYKPFSFGMGKTALGHLLDDLGRKTTRVTNYEKEMLGKASSIAIDGHAIRSCSDENDLAEVGYKFNLLKEEQINLLMGYDIKNNVPLFARMYRGSCNDKSTIADLSDLLGFSGLLFVVDRGFYSDANLKIFSSNDNSYIIPIPGNTDVFKSAMKNVNYTGGFYYKQGNKRTRIEYMSQKISGDEYVYVFRDIDENEKIKFNYLRSIDQGKKGYTQEGYERNKEFFGVYVLRSNAAISAEGVFNAFKDRWKIETFYQYLKNKGDFNDLMIQDYYKEQGFAFMMLITGQIHQRMIQAIKLLEDNTTSVRDLLLMARCLKMERRGNIWALKNARQKDLSKLKKVGFEPMLSSPA